MNVDDIEDKPVEQVEQQEQTTGETPAEVAADPQDEGEVVVTIGDEQPAEDEAERAPAWVRELRKSHRETVRALRQKDEELAALKAKMNTPSPAELEVGPEPTLEGCNYDGDKFKADLLAWTERKAKADDAKRRAEDEQRKATEAWQMRLQTYETQKKALKVPDFEEAEDAVKTLFNVTQQGIVLHGADRPEVVIYALGKNPAKAKELAAITDPVKFAIQLGKLETQMKVSSRKDAPPPPEKVVRSNVPGSAAVDNHLDKLRAEAEKSGDYTKVHQYKRQLRQKQAA